MRISTHYLVKDKYKIKYYWYKILAETSVRSWISACLIALKLKISYMYALLYRNRNMITNHKLN